ncbi:MAG: septation protein IspZ [Halioglobus sp.]|nr:septation protein IspZ [Halioglobus sp.]
MKQFIEFIPVALFAIVFFAAKDIYIATVVLMAGICIQVAYEYISTKRIEKKIQVIFWVAMIFGGATLLFRNEAFLLWKPTVINWLFAGALVVGQFASSENLLKKMLGEQLTLPNNAWKHLNLGWAFGFFVAGVLNLFVAFNFSLEFWVSYKLVGGIAITMLYMVITMVYLARGGYLSEESLQQKSEQ